MAESDEAPLDYEDPAELRGVHLLTCRRIWFDNQKAEAGFGLAGIITHIVPPEGYQYPFRLDRVFVYSQLWGDAGEYRLRVRLVKIVTSEDDKEEEMHLGPNGNPREFPMPAQRPAVVTGLEYVEQVAFPIGPVPFREAGLYEFQLWADGIDQPISRERVFAVVLEPALARG